jgi:hypothetical protein
MAARRPARDAAINPLEAMIQRRLGEYQQTISDLLDALSDWDTPTPRAQTVRRRARDVLGLL